MNPPRTPRPRRRLSHDVDTDCLAFLYGDAMLPKRAIAKFFDVPIAEITRLIRIYELRPGRPIFGEWNRAAFAMFAGGAALALPPADRPDEVWERMRPVVRRELPKRLSDPNRGHTWLSDFVRQLPGVIGAAETRLMRLRLEFLYGDLHASVGEIATAFDAPFPMVKRVLSASQVLPKESYFDSFRDLFQKVAKGGGLPAWDFYPTYRDSTMGSMVRERVAFKRMLLAHAVRGEVDWNGIDLVLATENARRARREETRRARS